MGFNVKNLNKIKNLIEDRTTLLGAGPMSKFSIDAIIELSNFYNKPIAMIPSRRQIECKELGGGYVEHWSTQSLVEYVRAKDSAGNVLLARDHCGPWQLEQTNLDGSHKSLSVEMDEVKISLRVDIESGFDIIHLDPSLGTRFGYSKQEVREILYELMTFCESIKASELLYEVGTEEQNYSSFYETEVELQLVLEGLKLRNLPMPTFFVLQTGTKVVETRNVGSFDNPLDSKGILPTSFNLPRLVNLCNSNGVWLKSHNCDYMSNEALSWHPRFGIHASNVAPEFGFVETKALVELAKKISAQDLIEIFTSEVSSRGKWKKWLLQGSQPTDYEKLLIAGHYHFSEEWHKNLRSELSLRLESIDINLNDYIYNKVKNAINRYLINFGY